MTQISNIDDILASEGGAFSQANLSNSSANQQGQDEAPPEQESQSATSYDEFGVEIDADDSASQSSPEEEASQSRKLHDEPEQDDETQDNESIDEYGNQQDEENAGFRKRLSKIHQRHSAEINALKSQINELMQNPQQVAQAAENSGFEYDPDSAESWDKQLRKFVKQVWTEEINEKHQQTQRQEEMRHAEEFRAKFVEDSERFSDFEEVINSLPISDVPMPVVNATRGMKNPAAFMYAAAKRAPQEFAKICAMRDPYAQAAEIGRLEARLRSKQAPTKAPRPLGKAVEDSKMATKKQSKSETIEDLIAASDKKRLALVNSRGNPRGHSRGR